MIKKMLSELKIPSPLDLGDRRVQNLGDRIDNTAVADGHQDGCTKILVALNVRGHTDLMNDLGDL